MGENQMAGESLQVAIESAGPQQVDSGAEELFDIATCDRRDEDDVESHDDPYTYSDDSASLSDAYFFPQSDDELARPPRYKEEDTLHQYPVASYYGALDNQSKATQPLWLGGSIQEDAEMVSLPQYDEMNTLMTTSENSVNRKKNRRQQRKLLSKQRERISRERAVAQIRGRPQKVKEWQDKFFAFLFLAQLIVILLLALRFGLTMFQNNSKWLSSMFRTKATSGLGSGGRYLQEYHSDKSHTFEFTIDYKNVIDLVSISGTYACILACFSFGFMLILGKALIQFVLVFSILVALAWGIIGLTEDPYGIISIMGFSALLMTLGYAFTSWHRIPFVATNLHTALHAMRSTADVTILGFASLAVALIWIIVWSMAFIGLVNSFNSAECTNNLKCEAHVNKGHLPLYLVLLFSFHWTNTVIKNVVRVTVASAVGTWWFCPNHVEPLCSRVVLKPLHRAITKSLGSICLGSLVVQPRWLLIGLGKWCCCLSDIDDHDQMLLRESDAKKQDVESAPEIEAVQSESAADSIGASLELSGCRKRCHSFLRSCNRWSYTYIGLYGYSFEEAGERALQLFETRGWMAVVSDSFISNILLMACIIIGGSTGAFAVVVEEVDGFFLTSFHKPVITAFLVGSVVGYVLGDILLLGLVSSAVDTILVCFAAAPFDFDKNHRILSREMREAWSQHVWEAVH